MPLMVKLDELCWLRNVNCEFLPWILIHLHYEIDPGEGKSKEGGEREVEKPDYDKVDDLCQRCREGW